MCLKEKNNSKINFTVRCGILYKLFPKENKIALAIPNILIKHLVHYLHNKYCQKSAKRLYNIFKIKYYTRLAESTFKEEQQNCYTCAITQRARNEKQTIGRERHWYFPNVPETL